MAVYTNISKEELENYLRGYNIGSLINFSKIIDGVENSNFLVKTTKSKYILTIFEKRVDEDELPFFIELMTFFKKNNLLTPLPIKNNEGEVINKLSNKPAAFFTFLDGKSILKPNSNHCLLLGETLGSIHDKAKKFKLKRKNSVGHLEWIKMLQSINPQKAISEFDYFPLIEKILIDILENWPDHLRKSIIHADLFPNNVFFKSNKISGIIDFYFSCYDIVIYDLAICINSWCFDENQNFINENFLSIIEGYEKINLLTTYEKFYFCKLCSGAAIRILLTRIYDYINTPKNSYVVKHDPNQYWRILNFYLNLKNPEDLFQ